MIHGLPTYATRSFQKVQRLSATQTSVRFIPNVVIGLVLSVAIGMILHRASTYGMVLGASCLSTLSPLLIAIQSPSWSYWYATCWSVLFSPLAGDSRSNSSSSTVREPLAHTSAAIFVISALVITHSFPDDNQALASAVFNTISQFGTAGGVAIMAVISSTVTQLYVRKNRSDDARGADGESPTPHELLQGYRASWWACFGLSLLTCAIAAVGLRNAGSKGMKK